MAPWVIGQNSSNSAARKQPVLAVDIIQLSGPAGPFITLINTVALDDDHHLDV
jgi:hypothetical protein